MSHADNAYADSRYFPNEAGNALDILASDTVHSLNFVSDNAIYTHPVISSGAASASDSCHFSLQWYGERVAASFSVNSRPVRRSLLSVRIDPISPTSFH